MNADITVLYSSDFYKVIDFKCKCKGGHKSMPEFSTSFNISFIRKGNFTYKVFRGNFDSYNGYAIVDKPGSEHIVEHMHHIPDECTIFDFSGYFYETIKHVQPGQSESFFENTDIQSVLVKTNPDVEYLHFLVLQQIRGKYPVKIAIDILVMELLEWFLDRITDQTDHKALNTNLKKHHLQTIEQAKNYISHNYIEDISLTDIAGYCHVSPFHFSRIFKKVTDYSPYQFLLDTRLKNAEFLIRNSNLQLKEISYQSGFNCKEHFNEAFRKKFGCPPSVYRKNF
ncbi:MAG TPA: AraC family transcriptional regulator [Bacteroidales bacterium]